MTETDEQKWKRLAIQYRHAAEALRHGPQRALLMRKARRLETAVERANDFPDSFGLVPLEEKSA